MQIIIQAYKSIVILFKDIKLSYDIIIHILLIMLCLSWNILLLSFFYTNHKMNTNQGIIRQCVLIGQSLEKNYHSANIFQKVGLVPAIDHTIAWLLQNNINQIFFFYSSSKELVEEYQAKVWSKINELRVHMMFMKPEQMKNFGDVMREVQFANILSQDFIIMYADSICNFNLSKAISQHFRTKVELKNVVLTSIMQTSSFSDKIHVKNSSTNEILQMDVEKETFKINAERINLKKMNVQFRRDLIHCEIYLCTIDVFKSFKETFQYVSMYDFIHGMLTSEVYEEKIMGYILENHELSYRINLAHNYYAAFTHFISNHFHPYTMQNRSRGAAIPSTDNFVRKNFNKVIFNTAEIAKTSKISNSCLIGKDSQIQESTVIDKCIISNNCKIKKDITLKNCIILQGTIVTQDCQYCLIETINDVQHITSFSTFNKQGNIKKLLIDRDLFQQTPDDLQQKENTFEQQLINLIQEDPDIKIITQLISVQKNYNKSLKQFTKQIFRLKQPKGVKGVEEFIQKWGEVLLKMNQTETNLINATYYSCEILPSYKKAFHVFLQYLFGFKFLNRYTILQWFQQATNSNLDPQILNKCEPFIESLKEEEDEDSDGEESSEKSKSDQ